MNLDKFSLCTDWKVSSDQNYLIDSSTGEQYPNIDEKEMMGKSGILAASTPVAHIALAVGNIAVRIFRVMTFYNFWKTVESEKEYNFKARALDTAKDLGRALAQPAGIIALEVVSFIGLFRPFDGMKLYYQLENALYGRPFMAQVMDIVPTQPTEISEKKPGSLNPADHKKPADQDEAELLTNLDFNPEGELPFALSDDTDFSEFIDDNEGEKEKGKVDEAKANSDDIPHDDESEAGINGKEQTGNPDRIDIGEDPLTTNDEDVSNLPSLEERLQTVLDSSDLNNALQFRQIGENCCRAIAEHLIASFKGDADTFDTFLDDQIAAAKDKIRNSIRPELITKESVLRNLITAILPNISNSNQIILDEVNTKAMQLFIKIPSIKADIESRWNASLPAMDSSNLQTNAKLFYGMAELVKQIPELKTDTFKAKQQEIVNLYVQTFNEICTAVETNKPNENIRTHAAILQVLIGQIDDKVMLNGILEKLLLKKFDWDKHQAYFGYFNQVPDFNVTDPAVKSMIGSLMSANTAKNSPVTLDNFSELVKNILNFLPAKHSNNFYLEYFRIQVKVVLEDMANQIHDQLEVKEFNLNEQGDAELNRNLQSAIARINKEFESNIEFKIQMHTENDEYIALLQGLTISIKAALGNIEDQVIEDWIERNQHTNDLQEFAQWLAMDNYCGTLNLTWQENVERSVENLYTMFVSRDT